MTRRFSSYVMAALRGGHPGQHGETFRATLDGRVKPGHDVCGVVAALGGRLDEGESPSANKKAAQIKKEGVFTPSLARSTCKRGLGSVEATGPYFAAAL
jgi:hypothetical protein